MKRKILLLASLILSALPIVLSAQMTYVPDDYFEQALINLGLDTHPRNDSIPTKNIDTVSVLRLGGLWISDLTGIEDFKSIKSLNCQENLLTTLDLSNNKALTEIYCTFNDLSILILGDKPNLIKLFCGSNQLNELNLSNCPGLINLECHENQLENLDLSNNLELQILNCSANHLNSLDIINNQSLIDLTCCCNKINNLIIRKNLALEELYCFENQITDLDISRNLALLVLDCGKNNLINLDISKNGNLKSLLCYSNKIIGLDVSQNPALINLNCSQNQLLRLNIKNGNNYNMTNDWLYSFASTNNPNLKCIQVDDSVFSANNKSWLKDSTAHYSTNCGYTGVNDYEIENEFISVSPNPAKDYIELNTSNHTLKSVVGDVRIYNILGMEITTPSVRDTPPCQGGEIVRIDISGLAPGVYFVRVGNVVRKFVKM